MHTVVDVLALQQIYTCWIIARANCCIVFFSVLSSPSVGLPNAPRRRCRPISRLWRVANTQRGTSRKSFAAAWGYRSIGRSKNSTYVPVHALRSVAIPRGSTQPCVRVLSTNAQRRIDQRDGRRSGEHHAGGVRHARLHTGAAAWNNCYSLASARISSIVARSLSPDPSSGVGICF